MKESDIEGLASHDGPEPCGGVREGVREASVGARAGLVLSREIKVFGVPTPLTEAEGNIAGGAIREPSEDSARSKTLCMHGISAHENREVR
jgi:hypothetical protein